jgi:hypothetical protein
VRVEDEFVQGFKDNCERAGRLVRLAE